MTPEQRKQNEATVAAMTDDELREIKNMINVEQVRRIQDEINTLYGVKRQ